MTNTINEIKAGISIRGLRPEMAIGFMITCSVFNHWGVPCVVTSGTSGKHGRASLHYVGLAIDIRIRDFVKKSQKVYGQEYGMTNEDSVAGTFWTQEGEEVYVKEMLNLLTEQLKDALGPEFDVVLERERLHIHIEYQPKTVMNVT